MHYSGHFQEAVDDTDRSNVRRVENHVIQKVTKWKSDKVRPRGTEA